MAVAAGRRRLRPYVEGAVLAGGALLLAAMLASYRAGDPSLDVASGASPANWLGPIGSGIADLALQLLGYAAIVPAALSAAIALRRVSGVRYSRAPLRLLAGVGALAALAWLLAMAGLPAHPLPAGPGGALGAGLNALAQPLMARLSAPAPVVTGVTAFALALIGIALFAFSAGLRRADLIARKRAVVLPRSTTRPPAAAADRVREPRTADHRIREARLPTESTSPSETRTAKIEVTPQRPREQFALPLDAANAKLPSLALLRPPPVDTGPAVDPEQLQENARALEQVLDDYGVEGTIEHVRAGPVVTMYELEPAAGTKAARVIALADDIARSMSAISARVAVVPGRTILGIELPNLNRQTVVLSELLGSAAYQDAKLTLPLILGKNIAGDPVIADLAPMPHLLIAGTTGAGKSVGLNAMILSLLYKLTPEQCRLILIDPKMLELSVYDNIPHLLAPVVTEPAKAIRALKWAVEQMDERYRMMASINVRSLAVFNQRVRDAKVSGKPFVRKVQTGFDAATGLPQYEEQTYDFEPLPTIVIIIDELADLMMVAGKEIEFLVQRLAQKARAAGIHLIMATQRPSVDVITGVIKANLPTRISFQVTSKIDSRTILGEQGAEQLLGKGDMLYMPGGKQVARVHGPFVSDEEVEAVADHWRAQGRPDYVDAVTEEPAGGDDGPLGLAFAGTAADNEGDDYRRACQVVAEAQKASTSYIQRQLRIGYNSAARLIERMEKEGVVGPSDSVGRREVLVDREGNRL